MTSKGPNAKNPEGRAIGPNLGPCWAKMGPSWRQVGAMLELPGLLNLQKRRRCDMLFYFLLCHGVVCYVMI